MLTYYTVSVDTIAGYLACEPQSYQAGYQTERNISFQYIALGAFVEATDGTLYTASAWASAGKTANSVVFITENISVRIALVEAGLLIHSNETTSKDNYMEPLPDTTLASVDYDGKSNTTKLVRFNIAYNTNTNSYAAPYCNNYTFPDGITKAYLPSLGQGLEIAKNKSQIDSCLTACGGTLLGVYTATYPNYMWTSTYYGVNGWNYYPMYGVSYDSKTLVVYRTPGDFSNDLHLGVRPIADYE